MNWPMITGGGKVQKRYRIGDHQAILVESPESIGPIKYKYVFIVYDDKSDKPVLFITSEKNQMQAELLEIVEKNSPELVPNIDPKKYFLGIFQDGVHSNVGGSIDWGDPMKFELKALNLAKELLNYPEDVNISIEEPVGVLSRAKNIVAFVAFAGLAAVLYQTVDVIGDWFQSNPWWLNIGIFVGIGWLGTAIFEKISSKLDA